MADFPLVSKAFSDVLMGFVSATARGDEERSIMDSNTHKAGKERSEVYE